MDRRTGDRRIHPLWWTAILVAVTVSLVSLSSMLFAGTFLPAVRVTLTSDRAGLVMESGAKIKMRGVLVGRVAGIAGRENSARLTLDIFPDQIHHIPANVEAEIRATTALGAKYVDLVYPEHPTSERLHEGAVLLSRNVSTEVNTVFQNIVDLLKQVDAAKLNAILGAFAEGVRGQGERIGQATSDANQVLIALNQRMDAMDQDWRSLKGFADTYGDASKDILSILEAFSTTSVTITEHASALDTLLLNTIGLSRSGIDLLAPNKDNLVAGVNQLEPTTNLLMKYNPALTCTILGVQWQLDNGALEGVGGNGRTSILDVGLTLGMDQYRYPDNLPIIAAKGGPGGKPGCGSLPDVSKNYPVRQLITNTGFGTGLDFRPNAGIGHPFYESFFPVTRAVPEPPSVRGEGPPAIGPVPYPGAPPYGAPLYGSDGAPLYPGVPPAPATGGQTGVDEP
jgi:phospholipid/cholesterol/gamma-HCH transport system substrate-binding protein